MHYLPFFVFPRGKPGSCRDDSCRKVDRTTAFACGQKHKVGNVSSRVDALNTLFYVQVACLKEVAHRSGAIMLVSRGKENTSIGTKSETSGRTEVEQSVASR